MPDMESVGSALLITLSFLVVSITIVALAMWGVYRFFKNKDEPSLLNDSNEELNHSKGDKS